MPKFWIWCLWWHTLASSPLLLAYSASDSLSWLGWLILGMWIWVGVRGTIWESGSWVVHNGEKCCRNHNMSLYYVLIVKKVTIIDMWIVYPNGVYSGIHANAFTNEAYRGNREESSGLHRRDSCMVEYTRASLYEKILLYYYITIYIIIRHSSWPWWRFLCDCKNGNEMLFYCHFLNI